MVVEYLKTPPTKADLQALLAEMGVPVRAILQVVRDSGERISG